MEQKNDNLLSKSEFSRQAGISRQTLYTKYLSSGLLDEYIKTIDGKELIDKAGLQVLQVRPAVNQNLKSQNDVAQIISKLNKCVSLLIDSETKAKDLQNSVRDIVDRYNSLSEEARQSQEVIAKMIEKLEIEKTYKAILEVQSALLAEKDKRIATLEAQLIEKDRQLERKDILEKDRQTQEKAGFFRRIFG